MFNTGTYIEDIPGDVPIGKHALQQGILVKDQTTEDLFQVARAGNKKSSEIYPTGRRRFRNNIGWLSTLHPTRGDFDERKCWHSA